MYIASVACLSIYLSYYTKVLEAEDVTSAVIYALSTPPRMQVIYLIIILFEVAFDLADP